MPPVETARWAAGGERGSRRACRRRRRRSRRARCRAGRGGLAAIAGDGRLSMDRSGGSISTARSPGWPEGGLPREGPGAWAVRCPPGPGREDQGELSWVDTGSRVELRGPVFGDLLELEGIAAE